MVADLGKCGWPRRRSGGFRHVFDMINGREAVKSGTPGPRTATEQAQGLFCVPRGVARWIDAGADRIARHRQGEPTAIPAYLALREFL